MPNKVSIMPLGPKDAPNGRSLISDALAATGTPVGHNRIDLEQTDSSWRVGISGMDVAATRNKLQGANLFFVNREKK